MDPTRFFFWNRLKRTHYKLDPEEFISIEIVYCITYTHRRKNLFK